MLRNVYICPFHSRIDGQWPYDTGDDPSFESMGINGGPLTWGVCRPQVRSAIGSGDVVIFVSFHKSKDPWHVTYRFCAVATVAQKVSQVSIWSAPELAMFRKYKNLLLAPASKNGWKHFEPGFGNEKEHKDWIWRLIERRGFKKQDLSRLNEKAIVGSRLSAKGSRVSWGKGYVLFSSRRNETYVLRNPPEVAYCRKNGQPESWLKNRVSKKIFSLTVGCARKWRKKNRTLRTKNKERSHPHIRFELPERDLVQWRRILIKYLKMIDAK